MRIIAVPGRYLAVPLGALLLASGLLAAGHPAIAASAGTISSRAASAGRAAPWRPGAPDWPRNVPRPGSTSGLNGIYCTSVANCWAVGSYTDHEAVLNQVLHWNGRRWSQVTAPEPGGTRSQDASELVAVRCASAGSCWAVGYYQRGRAELSEALHWNGKRWYAVATPSPGGTGSGDDNELLDVFCTSASSCWAAGEYGALVPGSETFKNLAEHWNGKRWSKVTTPNPGGTSSNKVNGLDGIRCPRASDCWAVGTFGTVGSVTVLLNEALHWNGKRWSKATVPSPGGLTPGGFSDLESLGCLSAADCWAVGAYGSETVSSAVTLDQALHWNGKRWSKAVTPDPDGTGAGADNNLLAVSCFSASDCWAVGEAELGSSHAFLNVAMQWNGRKWVLHPTPDPGGRAADDTNSLEGVRCPSRSDCWAAGAVRGSGGSAVNELLRWNGSKWTTG